MLIDTLPPTQLILPVVGVFMLALFVRSSLGFGDALIAMPLLSFFTDLQTATPLVALMGFSMAIGILLSSWRDVDIKAAWRLILASALGIPIGLYLLTNVPEGYVLVLLGLILIGYGVYNLAQFRLPEIKRDEFAFLFGFVAGILGGAYNTNGPPVVIYGSMRRWEPQFFRATLQAFFISSNFMIVLGHGLSGLWTPTVLWLSAIVLPIAIIMVITGGLLMSRMPQQLFSRIIYFFLIVIGVVMIVRVF